MVVVQHASMSAITGDFHTIFSAGDFEQALFVWVVGDEAVHFYFILLTDTMATGHGLEVILHHKHIA